MLGRTDISTAYNDEFALQRQQEQHHSNSSEIIRVQSAFEVSDYLLHPPAHHQQVPLGGETYDIGGASNGGALPNWTNQTSRFQLGGTGADGPLSSQVMLQTATAMQR